MTERSDAVQDDPQFSAGYLAYQRGQKIPRERTQRFVEGWWEASEAGEKFGEYESFLQAPE